MILNIKCYISNMYSIGCEVKTSICRYWAAGKSGAQISMASPVISARRGLNYIYATESLMIRQRQKLVLTPLKCDDDCRLF